MFPVADWLQKFQWRCFVDFIMWLQIVLVITLPETNIAPENGWLEYYFPFGMFYFQGLC